MRRISAWCALVALTMTVACTAERPAAAATAESSAAADQALVRQISDTTQWATYGHDFGNQRFSPLSQITAANVARLRPAWTHHSTIAHSSESNPLVVDGVMYFSSARNHVFAVDARTGQTLWEYAHDYKTTVDCCGAINRGVTVYGGRVFMNTVDARMIALDAKTGRKLWDVQVGDNEAGYHMTGTPLAVQGLVISGVSGGEQGCRCYVDAYDAASGARVWRWYTIPSPAEGGWWGKWRATDDWGMSFNRDIAREHADSAKFPDSWQHGGGPVWHHPAYDPKLGLVFINVGNPAPDIDDSERPGDNLYTDCVVALDVKTGHVRWYYQTISHDRWDYDPSPPPVLVDLRDSSGAVIPALVQASKVPWVYVLDRRTGKPIRRSDAYLPTKNLFVTPTREGVVIAPGPLGGTDWSPTAVDARTGTMYLASNYFPFLYKLHHEPLRPPAQWWGGVVVGQPTGTGGYVTALDLNTGKVDWQVPTGRPMLGGVMVTAGGVLFAGLSSDSVIALDAHTGARLWSAPAPAGVNAPPITYMVGGVQYVAVAATGAMNAGSDLGDAMLVYSLGPAVAASVPATAAAARTGGTQ